MAPHIVTFHCVIGSEEVWNKDKCLSEDLNGRQKHVLWEHLETALFNDMPAVRSARWADPDRGDKGRQTESERQPPFILGSSAFGLNFVPKMK